MAFFSTLSTGLVAGLHGYIFILESFLWTTPRGRAAFKLTPEFALQTRTLAANQGVYNGFLAAGLVWGLLHPVPEFAKEIKLFFLGCVGVAGLVGGMTSSRRIMGIQTAPALVAAVCTVLGW
ncbi:hypothetical protein N0V93_006974 [Gnomoniopsis smithogilvyi]|uniref:Integral membrane protein n=1 Tax=Gnomoniopsis smithogilvyi TaxID=1191159 RepID=A0A9W8YQE3_9PEZI|nr:hypothetical protein N0V93_006974 [Gnomoniopsis smithogilvyi]